MATATSSNTPTEVTTEDVETNADSPAEHVIVGVDIGYTCTGVAISSLNRSTNEPVKPFAIQKWPGSDRPGRKTAAKVDTLVTYKAGDLRVQSWGFGCPSPRQIGPGMNVKGLFKFLLDPEYLEEVNEGKSDEEGETDENVKKWFTDFLTKLYEYIVEYLEGPTWHVEWGSTKVEFHFSLPTSWEKNGVLVEDFGKIIKKAGFGSGKNTSMSIGLTEAAASAVYTAKILDSNFKEDDMVLVCDAGGGTTDICVLKVAKIDRMTVQMETIEETSIFVGSVQIDEEFEALFTEKLRSIREQRGELLEDFSSEDYEAQDDAREKFENIKQGWGTRRALPRNVFAPPRNLTNVRIEFSSSEINTMFDNQIDLIIAAIDEMLGNLRKLRPEVNVRCLVLAGGLGSSKYVQSKLQTQYDPHGMTLLVEKKPTEPPLSVCRGLVLDRLQRIMHGTSILRTRRSRASYGIVYPEIYKKAEHKGREIFKNSPDGKKYVTGRVRWFIKKGDIVGKDFNINPPHELVASFGDPDKTWEDVIVTSRYAPNFLPHYIDQGDCQEVLYGDRKEVFTRDV